MTDQRIAKPPPAAFIKIEANRWTAPFWEGAARHQLLLPRCAACGHYRMPPTAFCPECRSQDIDWTEDAGPAFLYSYTIVDRAIMPGMEDDIPYVPAVVEFPHANNVRLITNIIGSRLDALKMDAPVYLSWHDIADGISLPLFTLADQPE